MNFDERYNELIGKEGGYSNHPNDPGGETMYGITIGVARTNGYTGRMIDLTREQAKAIYYKEYYVKPGFEKINEINGIIAGELFDTGVNMGQHVAGEFLQRSLNALNAQGTLYPDLSVDGRIGPVTIRALEKYLAVRERDGIAVLHAMLNVLQGYRYIQIAENKKTSEDFIFGWFRTRILI